MLDPATLRSEYLAVHQIIKGTGQINSLVSVIPREIYALSKLMQYLVTILWL